MKIHNQTIFDLVVANAAQGKPVAYYSYTTGTESDTYVAEVEKSDVQPGDAETIQKLVDRFLDEAVEKLRIRRDNKTAVKCVIPGIDQPIYFVFYDWKYVICTTVVVRTGREFLIPDDTAQSAAVQGGHHGEGDE